VTEVRGKRRKQGRTRERMERRGKDWMEQQVAPKPSRTCWGPPGCFVGLCRAWYDRTNERTNERASERTSPTRPKTTPTFESAAGRPPLHPNNPQATPHAQRDATPRKPTGRPQHAFCSYTRTPQLHPPKTVRHKTGSTPEAKHRGNAQQFKGARYISSRRAAATVTMAATDERHSQHTAAH